MKSSRLSYGWCWRAEIHQAEVANDTGFALLWHTEPGLECDHAAKVSYYRMFATSTCAVAVASG